jgi:hypothetical protein
MNRRQRELERWFCAIVILLPIFDERRNIYQWVKAMRMRSRSKRSETDNLEQANSEQPLPSPTAVTAQTAAQHVADICQGNGSIHACKAICSTAEANRSLLSYNLHQEQKKDYSVHPRGLYKEHVDAYLQCQLEKHIRHWFIPNKHFSLALEQFKGINDLWSILQEGKGANEGDSDFVSFYDLDWLIQYLGESLKEAVESQKNLKQVINSLDVRLTLLLCIPVAIVYGMLFFSVPPSQFSLY